MFNFFGLKATEKDDNQEEGLSPKKNKLAPFRLRRTEEEVFELFHIFKNKILSSKEIQSRIKHFWFTDEERDSILFAIGYDIPKDKNPLEVEKSICYDLSNSDEEDQEEEKRKYATNSKEKKKKFSVRKVEQETKKKDINKKKIASPNKSSRYLGQCVEWLGLVNRYNRYAAIKLKLPKTYESWYTFMNRLIVYLFADIPNYFNVDDFHKLLNVRPGDPFLMLCENPLCVRLSHIDYLKEEEKI